MSPPIRVISGTTTWLISIQRAGARRSLRRPRSRSPRGPPKTHRLFLSVGFFETHREFFEPSSIRDVLYSRPPENVPDNAQTRRDMASFRASARALDQGVGTVLNALEENGLADDTLVIMTTDHGLAFPDAKCTMYDRGIGVMLLIRGPGGFERGRVSDALVSQLDLFPTICDVAGT